MDKKKLELYGYGSNAHGQMNLNLSAPREYCPHFKWVTSSRGFLRILRASWSQVVIHTPGSLTIHGHKSHSSLAPSIDSIDSLVTVFGDHNDTTHILRPNGALLPLISLLPPPDPNPPFTPPIAHIARTSTGRTAIVPLTRTPQAPSAANLASSSTIHVMIFPTPEAFLVWLKAPSEAPGPERHHMLPGVCAQLASYATGFVLRSATGEVYTWGDPRYPRSLGRGVQGPEAQTPGVVEGLGGLEIVKIAACEGGWVVGAVTVFGDAFVWGGRAAEEMRWLAGLGEGVDGGGDGDEVGLVKAVLGEGIDVEICDIAVGVERIVVLDVEGGVWMAEMEGEGNGAWKMVEELKFEGEGMQGGRRKVVNIACGEGNAFAVVEVDDE